MARAKRHYIPGHVWHITHRCHKREFLLKFPRDRRRWIEWLYQAKKRYSGLSVLNYMVTSNHVHLLAFDNGGRNVIPDSIKLVAGYTLANSVTPMCANSFPHSIITHKNISGLPIAVNLAEWRKL